MILPSQARANSLKQIKGGGLMLRRNTLTSGPLQPKQKMDERLRALAQVHFGGNDPTLDTSSIIDSITRRVMHIHTFSQKMLFPVSMCRLVFVLLPCPNKWTRMFNCWQARLQHFIKLTSIPPSFSMDVSLSNMNNLGKEEAVVVEED
jgi:hypothetical protein